MRFARRTFLQLAAGVALPAVPHLARAATYPTRPVRIVAGFAAGGVIDIVARLMGQVLAERLGQPFVVENRPGAAGNIGTEAVVRSAPDGYTLLMAGTVNAINTALYDNLNFDFIRDIVAVASVIRFANLMVVRPDLPAKSVPDFIAYAKANPGKVNMASGGVGTPQHLSGELFKMMTGIEMIHIPYRGSAPALTDLMAGQVEVMFDALPSSIAHVRSGKLRAMAVTTAKRQPVLPDVPAVGEFVPGYETSAWNGLCAPKDTPPQIIATLNKAVNASLADSKLQERIASLGGTVLDGSANDFGNLISEDTQKWSDVIRTAGIKPG